MKLRGNGHKEDAKAISVEMQYLHEKLEKASEKGKQRTIFLNLTEHICLTHAHR